MMLSVDRKYKHTGATHGKGFGQEVVGVRYALS